jgi:hypothetical protein
VSTRRPAAPPGLSRPGRRLWRTTVADYEVTPPELVVLGEMCRIVDRIGALEAELDGQPTIVRGSTGQPKINPILAELRSQQLVLARLVDTLHLAEDEPITAADVVRRWSRTDA